MGRIKHNAITDISIHVPREGDDAQTCGQKRRNHDFNPRPP